MSVPRRGTNEYQANLADAFAAKDFNGFAGEFAGILGAYGFRGAADLLIAAVHAADQVFPPSGRTISGAIDAGLIFNLPEDYALSFGVTLAGGKRGADFNETFALATQEGLEMVEMCRVWRPVVQQAANVLRTDGYDAAYMVFVPHLKGLGREEMWRVVLLFHSLFFISSREQRLLTSVMRHRLSRPGVEGIQTPGARQTAKLDH